MGIYIPTAKQDRLLKYKYSSTDLSLTSVRPLFPLFSPSLTCWCSSELSIETQEADKMRWARRNTFSTRFGSGWCCFSPRIWRPTPSPSRFVSPYTLPLLHNLILKLCSRRSAPAGPLPHLPQLPHPPLLQPDPLDRLQAPARLQRRTLGPSLPAHRLGALNHLDVALLARREDGRRRCWDRGAELGLLDFCCGIVCVSELGCY